MSIEEFGLINKLEQRFGKPSIAVEVGVGDDAAVVSAGGGMRWAMTADALVEGVHFDISHGTFRQLGRKSLAVNLSDLAAMGADPRHALVALGIPESLSEAEIDELFDGIEELATEHRVSIVGGNLSRSPVFAITITAVGAISGPALLRSGGRPGDRLVVTGELGSSALGLALLRDSGAGREDEEEQALVTAHLDPAPRVAVGQALRGIATAGIDISDGLAQDAAHLARGCRCAARIVLEQLPLSPAYDRLTADLKDPYLPALAGGEDYELLLAVPAMLLETARMTALSVGTELHEVGELVQGEGVSLVDAEGNEHPPPAGWRHF